MNILIIHQHFYPEESGTAKSCTEMAVYFENKGYDVTVITEFPNRNFDSIVESKKGGLKKIDEYMGVSIHRLRNNFQYSSKLINRVSAYLMFTFSSSLYALRLKQNYDVCITIQALPSAIPGVLLQKVSRIPHHFYCTDMMPDLGEVSGMVKNHFIIWIARAVERYVYNNSTAVYAVTKLMTENIKEKSRNKNVFELPDWVDVIFFNNNRYKYHDEIKEKYDLQEKKIILYIGNIGFVQNLTIVVEVAKRMRHLPGYEDYIFIIGGGGVKKQELENLCKEHQLDNIRFIGVVDRKYVPSFLEISSILLMNYLNHPHMALYRSSKIFDYIIAEKPVIVGASGELAKIVKDHGLGEVASPSDPEEYLAKLLKLIDSSRRIDNQDLIEKYSKENILGSFNKKIQHVNRLINMG